MALIVSLASSTAIMAQNKIAHDAPGEPSKLPTQELASSSSYPPGELGKAIQLGRTLVKETSEHPLTSEFVGNTLNCTSCHLDAGEHAKAASFIGVASAYPAFSPRENKVITLEDRILACFERSQNGTRPPLGSKVSVSIAAYITWLSRDVPIQMNPEEPLGPNHITALAIGDYQPNAEHGQRLYAERCATCHSEDGAGTEEGPPVWGDRSYNDGAGLAKVGNLASWLRVAMPLDDADLTEEQAFDIANYLIAQPRPKFGPNQNK